MSILVITIYFQVISTFVTQILCLQLPGISSLKVANAIFIASFAKHILINGLVPPSPVMAQTAAVFVCLHFFSEKVGRYAFAAQNALSAVVFLMNPLMVLECTFPSIGGDSLIIGYLMIELVAFQSLWVFASAMTNGSAQVTALFWLLNLALMAKVSSATSLSLPRASRSVIVTSILN